METRPFELVSSYQPAGDQPQAIARLTEGLESGLAHQTLLGVTGSGKSIGYDDPLYIIERTADGRRTRLVPAGPFIDSLMAASELATTEEAETERFACAGRSFFTLAYDPSTGETREYPVAAFLRHRAPARMFRLSTQCGRAVVLTGDHNLWGAPEMANCVLSEPSTPGQPTSCQPPRRRRARKTLRAQAIYASWPSSHIWPTRTCLYLRRRRS